MTFVIITHVPHVKEQNSYFAYGPYVREMNIWIKQVEKVIVVAPITVKSSTDIDLAYEHQNIEFVSIESFDLLSIKAIFSAITKTPKICWRIYTSMYKASHIHLRCPGNVGLLGSVVQIFFPNKIKTAKYAGNLDPKSKQPWSYRLQKWILSNTFLSRNIQVLVYGEWEGMTKNIRPFFTATYKEEEKTAMVVKNLKGNIAFIFVGGLVKGKNPLYALKLVEVLSKKGYPVSLRLFGEGIERVNLETYIATNNLGNIVTIMGNHSKETVLNAYKQCHFVVLPSDSEGWPKAIAEGMFWGCVPVATSVSCVPFMLDYGNRGVLLCNKLLEDVLKLEILINNKKEYRIKQQKALTWSQSYTLDVFESEIKKMLI
jgi:glycosyltransferase involved in cell wall biosynthesis